MKIAVIGAGHMTNKIYCPIISALGDVNIEAICDRNPDKLHATKEKFQIPQKYENYQKMIENVLPDAVFAIGHPHSMYDVWMWCLQNSLNLFIEKPMGITLHQARALAYVAEGNSCITQVCFQRRASPMLNILLEECRARGKISFASVEFLKNAPDPFLGARDHMMDDGVHAIDTLRAICGGDVVAIHSVTKRIGTPDINLISALLEFDSGAIGQVHCNWASGYRQFRVGIHAPSICAEANLEGNGYLYRDGNRTEYDAREMAGSIEQMVLSGFQLKVRDFISCVRSRKQPDSNFQDALKTHIIAEKILANDLLIP